MPQGHPLRVDEGNTLNLSTWDMRIDDPQVLHDVHYGIEIDRWREHPPSKGENYLSTITYAQKVEDEIRSLLKRKKIVEVVDPWEIDELVVSPLGAVPKKDSTEVRPVLDLSRAVNPFLPHLKMELPSVDTAVNLLRPNWWMAKADLSQGYLHMPIARSDQRLLGFKWQGKFYKYKFLPFGLSTAPAIFVRAMEAIQRHFTRRGMLVVVYLDDFLVIAPDEETCKRQFQFLLDEFKEMGILVNQKKCISPTRACPFLGVVLDSVKMEIRVPEDKLRAIKEELAKFRAKFVEFAPCRQILGLVGKLSFYVKAVKGSRSFLRRMWD